MHGIQAPVAYTFFPNAAPGQKILEVPQFNRPPSECRQWLTDLHRELLDLRGEELTIRFHLCEC